MPQSPTPNMLLVQPSEDGDSDVWDTILTTLFERIDDHNHTTGLGRRIPSAAIQVDADIMWASSGNNYSITNLKAGAFTAVAASAVSSYTNALWVSSADNNLYFRNSLGTNVQITDGSTLNVSIVGGIGGDYSTVGALVDYDDANDTYRFRQETDSSVRQYAKVATADLILREYKAAGEAVVPVNAVTIKSPASLASAYTLTSLAALPAATQPITVSSAGQLEHGTSFAMDEDATITYSGTGGPIISGTGNYRHGTKTTPFAVHFGLCSTPTGTVSATAGSAGIELSNNTITYIRMPTIPSFARYKAFRLYFTSASDRGDCTVKLYSTSAADPITRTFTDTTLVLTNAGTAQKELTSVNLQPTSPTTYWIQVSNSSTEPVIVAGSIDWDVPT